MPDYFGCRAKQFGRSISYLRICRRRRNYRETEDSLERSCEACRALGFLPLNGIQSALRFFGASRPKVSHRAGQILVARVRLDRP
jgi:hypothetical protein